MKAYILALAVALLLSVSSSSQAAELQPGTYIMQSEAMQMKITLMQLPNGKLAVNGEGKSATGSSCRIGNLGTLQGNNLILGACSIPVALTAEGFEIQASPACIQCQPGASIQGSYKKQ